MEKLPGKLVNSGKTESAFFYGIFVMDMRIFFFFYFAPITQGQNRKNIELYSFYKPFCRTL
jgi:hypothetical protein